MEKVMQFHEIGLDDRLQQAIAKLGWPAPTLIQEKAIPLVLEGKDVLVRARTGSGKTAAYVIPMIEKILRKKEMVRNSAIHAVVITPTRELCHQAYRDIQLLCAYCQKEVRCVDISRQVSLEDQKPLLLECPDVIVCTPSRLLQHLQAGHVSLTESFQMLVIDEADLVFSLGYETEMKSLVTYLPKICQTVMMSATLTEDVITLKRLVLHNPVILKLEEPDLPESDQLTQYHIDCEEEDKFVLIYTLIKLALIRGKSIVFVNTIDKCYRLKLFLEQFFIRACVLNSELPVNSRCHVVMQFNEGLYDIIIAADERFLQDPSIKVCPKTNKKKKRDKESGVARGIDFHNVSNVINFDFPPDVDTYIHRVGRTARGTQQGTALSFVTAKEKLKMKKLQGKLAEKDHENFKPYQFKMEEIEGFRYRAKDAMKAVTSIAVREARLKEIKTEIINSKKLKTFFEDHPDDLAALRHDKPAHIVRLPEHLRNVPDYLVPKTLKNRKLPQQQKKGKVRKAGYLTKKKSRGQRRYERKKADPLQGVRG